MPERRAELFGTATQDSFQILSALDNNLDGKIDVADTAWSTLGLWVDANGNGRTDAGELHQLNDFNVTSRSLTPTNTPVLTIEGNASARPAQSRVGIARPALSLPCSLTSLVHALCWLLAIPIIHVPSISARPSAVTSVFLNG